MSPPDRINYSDQLCFIQYNDYWTPALLFTNYGVILKDLQDDLTPSQRYTLSRHLMSTSNAGPVAQILGMQGEDSFVLIQGSNKATTKPYFTSLADVWEETTVENLGTKKFMAWQRSMEHVDALLANELANETRTMSTQSTNTTVATDSDSDDDNTTTTQTKRKRDGRIWGRDTAKPKTQKVSTGSHTKMNNSKSVKTRKSSKKSLGPSAAEMEQSKEDFYVWRHIWSILKRGGWRYQRSRNMLHSWCYMTPDCQDQNTAIVGETMFCSEQDVLEYCIQIDLMGQVMAEDETPEKQKTKPQYRAAPIHFDDNDDHFSWTVLWPRLQREGWSVKNAAKGNAVHNLYYVKPNKDPVTGVLGQDYFASPEDVIQYEQDFEYGTQDTNDLATLTSRRITMSPERDTIATPTPPCRQEWFHTEELPDFKRVCWPILRDDLHFSYAGGRYVLPGGSASCRNDFEIRQYLVQHGIPHFDILTKMQQQELHRWITFCHVPVNSISSCTKLQHIGILDDDAATQLLCQLGMTPGFSWASHHFGSLAKVRVHVRATPELMPGRRRSQAMTLTEEQILELRVWAAMAPDALPCFNETGGCD